MNPQIRTERRQYPRKIVNIKVHVSGEDSGPNMTVSVRDISLQGMAIQTTGLSVNIGDKLRMCLSGELLDCGLEHIIETTVVNLHDGIAGLRFDSVGIYVLKDIQQLLRGERSF